MCFLRHLSEEAAFAVLAGALDLTEAQTRQLVRNGIEASFVDEKRKRELRALCLADNMENF